MKKIKNIIASTKTLEILFAISVLLIMILIGLITIDQKKLERRIKQYATLENQCEYDLEQLEEYHNAEVD